jgi:microcystin-dependent protein
MFGGATAPSNWIICDGSSLSTTGTYAALFAVLGYTYGGSSGNFNLPNLQAQFPLGVGPSNPLGQSGGSFSVSIAIGNMPAHAHPITDVAHSHGASQGGHNHTIVTGNHAHSITTGSHAHSGVVVPGGTFSLGQAGWSTSPGNTSTVGNLGGNTDTAGNLGGYTDVQQPGVTINASGTGLSTTQNAGSGTPLSVVPPYVALNYIIRFR